MSENARDFGLFIDGLRLDRNISREDLIEGIISLSQYKRYLRGASSIPNAILIQLSDRLKFSISDIHLMFRSNSDKQYQKVTNIYHKIRENKIDEALCLANEIKNKIALSDYNKLFFDFCMINIQHTKKIVSDVHVLDMYSNLIDYPKCAKNDSFNWVEIITLLNIVSISAKMENYEPSQIMYNTMISEKFISYYSGDIHFLPGVFVTLSQIVGKQNLFTEVVEITNRGIEYCKKYEVTTALAHLYIFNAIALIDLNQLALAQLSAKKAFMQAYLDGDDPKTDAINSLIERRFKMKGEDLLK